MENYPSIFGVEAPAFVPDFEGSPDNIIDLDYVTILRDEPDLDDIEHKSIKNGHREFTSKGKHWLFEIQIHLFKYAQPYDKYQELKSYKNSLVGLYKRRDGDLVMNDEDRVIPFFIEAIEEGYLEHYLYPDILKMRFVSQDPIDIEIGSSPGPVYSTEVHTYIDQFDTMPAEDVLAAIAEFIDGLVADGIYAKIDEMWLFAINTQANALKGMKAYKNCTLVNSPAFEALRGFTGNGTNNYINTNFNPAVDGINWSAAGIASFGLYSRTNLGSAVTGRYDIGGTSGATAYTFLKLWVNVTNSNIAIDSNGTGLSGTRGGDTIKFRVVTRVTSASTTRYYRDGTQLISSGLSPGALTNNNLYILALNNSGSAIGWSTIQCSFAYVGGILSATEVATFTTRLTTLLTVIGANV